MATEATLMIKSFGSLAFIAKPAHNCSRVIFGSTPGGLTGRVAAKFFGIVMKICGIEMIIQQDPSNIRYTIVAYKSCVIVDRQWIGKQIDKTSLRFCVQYSGLTKVVGPLSGF